jgi:hypothetical protein
MLMDYIYHHQYRAVGLARIRSSFWPSGLHLTWQGRVTTMRLQAQYGCRSACRTKYVPEPKIAYRPEYCGNWLSYMIFNSALGSFRISFQQRNRYQ